MRSSQTTHEALKRQVLGQHKKSHKTKGMPKSATLASYVGIFLLIITLVAIGYQPQQKSASSLASVADVSNTSSASDDQPSVDAIVANNVAGDIAARANLPIAPNLAQQSVSLVVKSQFAQQDDTVITKPQIVSSVDASRTVTKYTAKRGDTVEKLSARYGVSSTTIKWANNLTSDALSPGQKLSIPPVDGVVYSVQAGDTISGIARAYKANKERIIAYNDLELNTTLKKGTKLIIPDGVLPTAERPGYIEPSTPVYGGSASYPVVNNSILRASVGNRYAPGNCTWWAYERRIQLGLPVGSFWGNANTWALYASQAGYQVDHTPGPGAIMVDTSGWAGHVAIVETVNKDGSIDISEMNYGGHFNQVTARHITRGQAGLYQYIH